MHIYNDTQKFHNDKNTLLIHNSLKNKYRNDLVYDDNTLKSTRIHNNLSNPKPVLDLNSNLVYNKDYHINLKSPIDNRISLQSLQAQVYENKSKLKKENVDYSFLISKPFSYKDNSINKLNTPVHERGFNQQMESQPKTPHQNLYFNSSNDYIIKGEPIGNDNKCTNCKIITPKEIMELIIRERESSQKQVNSYLSNIKQNMEDVMKRFESISKRVLNREEEMYKLKINQMKVRPFSNESNENNTNKYNNSNENSNKSFTPIPILNPVMKPKQYKLIKNKWKKVKEATRILVYYYVVFKKAKQRHFRLSVFINREKTIMNDVELIKSFFIPELKPVFDEMKLNKNKSLIFDEKTEGNEATIIFNLLTNILRIVFKSLINKTLQKSIHTLPNKLLHVLYTYINNGFYYHQTFLSTFEINRLSFNIYGQTVSITKSQRGMIISLLIINKILIPYIFLNPQENYLYNERLSGKEIVNFKILSTLLYYLTIDAFRFNPVIYKDRVNILNYYRNYHLDDYNKYQTAMDLFDNDKDYGNLYESEFISKLNLFPELIYKIFLKYNKLFSLQLIDDIHNWGEEFGEGVFNVVENRRKFLKKEDFLKVSK